MTLTSPVPAPSDPGHPAAPETPEAPARRQPDADSPRRLTGLSSILTPYRSQLRRDADAALFDQVLEHYGRACACCGSTNQLSIDHVGGGGAAHRREVTDGRGGSLFWRWLIDHGFPDGFQTLCKPCNSSKGNGPACRIDHRSRGAARA